MTLFMEQETRFFTTLKISIASVLFFGFLIIVYSRMDPDLWWHLRVGEWVVKNNSVPRADVYSYTMHGFPWVNHEWLVDSILWILWTSNVWWITVLLFTLFVSIPLLYWIYKARSYVELWMILPVALFFSRMAGVRPQIISLFLFFLLFELLQRMYGAEAKFLLSEKDNPSRQDALVRYACFLPVFFFFWANLHAGFAAGLSIWGIMLVIHYIRHWWHTRGFHIPASFHTDIVLFGLSIILTFANPYGWYLHKEILAASLSPETLEYINEWQPAFATGMLTPVFFLGAGIVFLFVSKAYQKIAPELLGVAAATLLAFLRSVRNGPFFFITTVPLVQKSVETTLLMIHIKRRDYPFTHHEKTVYIMIGTTLYALLLILFMNGTTKTGSPYPEQAVRFLHSYMKEYKQEIHIFNPYGWGGYLIAKAPNTQVFIDGRMPHWVNQDGTGAMKDYTQISKKGHWQTLFRKHKINMVIWQNKNNQPATFRTKIRNRILSTHIGSWFANLLLNDDKDTIDIVASLRSQEWSVIYEDEISIVLVCNSNGPMDCYGHD